MPDIDLILLDMMMPEIDGLEACRTIQQYSELRDIPIIIVTAIGDSHMLAEALDAGAADYVTKPINRIELLARIRLALRLKQEKDWHKQRDRHIREELRLAARVQSSVLTEPLSDERITIDALYQPSEELAGDLYAWFKLGEGRYGIMIIDMMGHGVSSALLCMFIASVLRDAVVQTEQPDMVLKRLNTKFHQLHMSGNLMLYYMTALYVVVDTNERTIQYANAGHPPGIVMMEDGRMVTLESTGYPVGMFPELEVDTHALKFDSRARIALYTDGLLESAGATVESAMERIGALLKQEPSLKSQAWDELLHPPGKESEDDKCLVWADIH
ncbi:fused response regulator/phosphatase [Paenibacillus thiaminolyticus]|uniref:PP2C family protein-serine/threonine phosphatase n=1 Tax=Paenibacillus thiaminolyticus TaxID=49283 RepID=UPI00228282EA|nr:fused response regulator/phosphatase [Paenibacillus thiaminolyticus]MCY9612858.1 fused response regulator/phosphatase [Paenibacillus thiaminolyticus]MCY9618370.1 fused response regulator/phosphatase [Paenibacillus thiaminolyticus]MCY9625514.1 fused response regulator/phosphatase [Paenibacillus thiaminolyticus]MCY9639017.1 fused response regulator/phosphatase [Paenibacillus thiaminolyticus]MCY9642375.1 fused response regulator/phosphatase [Paenibacillus thiaminolyticus]